MPTLKTPSSRDTVLGQARGSLALTAIGLDHLTTRVHEFHRAISDIPFGVMAPLPGINAGSNTTRLVHDVITDGVYTAVRGSIRAAFDLAEFALRETEKHATPVPATASPRRDLAVSALAGFVGDDMAVKRNPLTPRMGFYRHGQRLALEREALAEAHVQASSRVVIFVHGLACTEHTWEFYTDAADPETHPYGPRLEQELGYTALYLRYNTGLHISRNGARLSRLIQRLSERWPVPLKEVVLVGHSMGGLVSRSAVQAGVTQQATWTAKVSNVICLGSPHLGAPLEQWVHTGIRWMDRFPLSRPLAKLLEARSVGVRDLYHGYVSDEDWRHQHDFSTSGGAMVPPKLETARYHFYGCSIGGSESDPISRVIGDGLVLLPSATAAKIADADIAVLFKTHHIRLVNHPVIYGLIRDALRTRQG